MTEVATQHQQPPRLPAIQAGGAIRAIVPQDFDSAWRIANVVVKSGMAPKGLETVEKAMVAIMHGLEIGLTPMNALQSIAVVNNKPVIYGDAAIGLVRASGYLESIEEIVEDRNGDLTAVCTAKRKGESTIIIRTFSEADAKGAGLLGKDGPWKTYKKRMLQMRARAFCLRDGFADVLKGLSIREEVEDYRPMKDVTPAGHDTAPPPPPPQAETIPAQIEYVQAQEADQPVAENPFDGDGWLRDLEGSAGGAETSEILAEVRDSIYLPAKEKVSDAYWKRACAIMRAAAERISRDEYADEDGVLPDRGPDNGPPVPPRQGQLTLRAV